jgi:hypothetical protein
MPPPTLRAPRGPRKPLPWLRISAGVAAILGTTATLIGCILPYGSFPDPNGGATTSSSIFSGGFVGAGWDIPEPVLVIILAAVAASLVLAGINRAVQLISAGLLLAMGAQTATMWAAYVGLAASQGQVEAGGLVGLGGAALLLIGGALALVNLAWGTPQTAETPAAQALA